MGDIVEHVANAIDRASEYRGRRDEWEECSKAAIRATLEYLRENDKQKLIAAAWAAWHSRHGGKLGPGPAFVEAIDAMISAALNDIEDGMIGPIYTLEEAAAKLRLEKRTVAKVARKNGLCSIAGREYRFSDSDLIAIWDTLRCPSSPSNETESTISVARTSSKRSTNLRDFAMKQAQKRLEEKSRRR